MKKSIFYILFLTACIANSQVRNYNGGSKTNLQTTVKPAQTAKVTTSTNDDSSSKFGIVGGLLIANEMGDNIEPTAPRTGFYAGLSYESNFSESVGLELNLVYANMGAEFNDEFNDELDYLQMPIMVNFKALNVLKIQVGPQIGYLLSAKFDDVDYIESLNEFDYGVVGGIGVVFPNTSFGINARYYYGLANINNEDIFSVGKVTNTSYSIGVFLNF